MSDGDNMDDRAVGIVDTEEWFGIGNEFAGVKVRKVYSRNGERLELFVPKTGNRILLDAMQLEIISLQEPQQFSLMYQRHLGADETVDGTA